MTSRCGCCERWSQALPQPRLLARAARALLADLARDPTRNRMRRFGQALVLAAEWPDDGDWLHAHFIHTPASVTAYASLHHRHCPGPARPMPRTSGPRPTGSSPTSSAAARWTVTCTAAGFEHLRGLAQPTGTRASELSRPRSRALRPLRRRTRRRATAPIRPIPSCILSVGRAVEKKGYDVLLEALALLPADLAWRFEHIGGGDELADAQGAGRERSASPSASPGTARWRRRTCWRTTAAPIIFALACRIAADGDRDGLPNVLVEASSQGLPASRPTVSGVPELLTRRRQRPAGRRPTIRRRWPRRSSARSAIPALRQRLGEPPSSACATHFDHHASIGQLDAPVRSGNGRGAMSGAAGCSSMSSICSASAIWRAPAASPRRCARRRLRRSRW